MTTPSLSQAQRRRRDALVLSHLALADRLAALWARRLGDLIERDDLIQVARLALALSAPRCQTCRPPAPYLRRCIQGALQHHLRDRVRLVRISRRAHESGRWPLRHLSAPISVLLNNASTAESIKSPAAAASMPMALATEALLEKLPAQQAAAVRLTVLQGRSLRNAAQALGTSPSTLHRRQRHGLNTLRQQLAAL